MCARATPRAIQAVRVAGEPQGTPEMSVNAPCFCYALGVDMGMSNYPVLYMQDPPVQRNRLTMFFRALLVIPHALWGSLYAIGFFVVVFVAWFAIVFTGRWPAGLYSFAAGYLRFLGRVIAYLYVICDTYPPFDGGEHPEYPVQVMVAPPQATYSRAKAFFRVILAIPIYIVQYVLSLWLFVVAIAIWFCGVFTGRTSPALMEAARMPMAFCMRATAYVYLVTEDWPPFDPGAPPTPAAPAVPVS